MVKNDLYLRALRGEQVERPPVWMMRQAGRFLPEFRQLRDKYDFFTRCQTPELVAEITLQPIRRFPLDAVILFSDILVVPQAMGINFKMKENVGPWLDTPIRTSKQIAQVQVEGAEQRLHYVYQGIASTLQMLDGKVPLIGFAGSPWTIFCYCIEGKGSKTFDEAKAFCFSRPAEAQMLLQKITDVTIAYLQQQAQAGVSAVQIFDSWGGDVIAGGLRKFLVAIYPTDCGSIAKHCAGGGIRQRVLVCFAANGTFGSYGSGGGLDDNARNGTSAYGTQHYVAREF